MSDSQPSMLRPSPGRHWPALGYLAIVLSSAGIAVLAYSALFSSVLLPAGWVPSEVARTIHRAELLQRLPDQVGRKVLVFGSSVVLEGVDSDIVERSLPPDAVVYNIAESSAGVRNLMINVPLISVARPAMLVCCLRRTQLAHDYFPDIPHDLLMGYSFAGYLDAGDSRTRWVHDLLTPMEKEILPRGPLAGVMASRVFFLQALEEKLRGEARTDLRNANFAANFRDPWRYVLQIPEDRLEMLVERSRKHFQSLRFDAQSPIARTLAACIERAEQSGIRFLLVITPENPRIQSVMPEDVRIQFDTEVEKFCRVRSARTWAVPPGLLSAADFLDHCHPNAQGREIFSRALAETISGILGN